MKKIILAVVVLLIIAGSCTPFFSGLLIEQIVKRTVGDVNQMYADTGSDMSVEIVTYDRDFYSSRVEWKIKFGALKAFYGIEEMVFLDQAHHGFYGVVSTTSLEKNKWFKNIVNNKLNGENPLEIKTEYKYSGDIESNIVMDGFSFRQGDDTFEMMPGQVFIKLDKGIKNIISQMRWGGCNVPEKFKIAGLSYDSKMERISKLIWDGNISFAIEHLTARDNSDNFELFDAKCDYTMDYNAEEQSLSFKMGYGAGNIKFVNNDIKDAFVQLNINRIDARGYEELVRLYSQMMNNVVRDIVRTKENPDAIKEAVEQHMGTIWIQMLGLYEKLLKKGFEIQIADLKAELPQGNIKGDFTLSLKKDMTMAQFIPIMMQPSVALDIFSLKSELIFPYQLIGDNQILLSPVYQGMQTGLFIKDKENARHTAQTREGKLFLNQKEVLLN